MMVETAISLPNGQSAALLAGPNEENLKVLEEELGVSTVIRGSELIIKGEEEQVNLAKKLLDQLSFMWQNDKSISPKKIKYALYSLKEDPETDLKKVFSEVILTTVRGKTIFPKTIKQREYIKAIETNDLVFGLGPAGTGKTYLAVALAIVALREKSVSKIILTRPVVEAGESLGFLPGDIQAKVNPYFRPLYDALNEMIDFEKYQKYIEKNIIEIAPLAYMRGRTLNDAFIILDEAQNTTPEQMKMFLTRMGEGSKAIITGDLTQTDLPHSKRSGLENIEHILKNIKPIKFVHFSSHDVVRHDLVQKIIEAYEKYGKERK
ncbi:MAG: PhoH family protein [Candidatus Sericytochromatia bacterium]|nr:PhoH family protein [Candidatus Sericytochromatia bacterium]